MDEPEKTRNIRQYHYVTVIMFASLMVFLLTQNILAVKLSLMGIIVVKAYGFLYKDILYEFYSCLLYMAVLLYFLYSY